jgi:NAD+ synthase (glutamine-hydrolysing)
MGDPLAGGFVSYNCVLMKIALAQINPTVGDIAGNAALIERDIVAAGELGADLVVFPELAITGYPPKDLLLKPVLIEQCQRAIESLAKLTAKTGKSATGIAAVIGYPCPSDKPKGRLLYNAAAFCHNGTIIHRHIKSLLPTYDVFDEQRYFESGPSVDLTSFQNIKLGISICEDLWNDDQVVARPLYHDNPIDQLAAGGASLFINCSASPFVVGKHAFRLKLMQSAAKRHGLPLLYCNQVGGNDELVFDGYSCAIDASGHVIAQAKGFEQDLLIVDLPGLGYADETARPSSCGGVSWSADQTDNDDSATHTDADANTASPPATHATGIASVYHALVLGLQDYCRKCGFKTAVMGLSGGIDSAVTAALAVAALGAENVRGVTMPSRYSSQGSVSDADDLAGRLGIRIDTVPIAPAHDAFEHMLAPIFQGLEPGVAEENIQARARGVVLMAMSNKFGSLLVTTGNKSELAVGYCTLYGDMAGGLAILSDVPKIMVYELAKWINDDENSPLKQQYGQPVIPENTIEKPPSAELRPDQVDQDSLPPYEVLDEIIERYVEHEQVADRIISETNFDADMVNRIVRLIDLNEYKRKQAAPGIKVTGRAFGFGRRMPIAQRYDARRTEK